MSNEQQKPDIKETPKIKKMIKDKLTGIKDDASLFVDIIVEVVQSVLTDNLKENLIGETVVEKSLEEIFKSLDLFDYMDAFVITLVALDGIGMEEELFDDIMLKMYYFIKDYFYVKKETV